MCSALTCCLRDWAFKVRGHVWSLSLCRHSLRGKRPCEAELWPLKHQETRAAQERYGETHWAVVTVTASPGWGAGSSQAPGGDTQGLCRRDHSAHPNPFPSPFAVGWGGAPSSSFPGSLSDGGPLRCTPASFQEVLKSRPG